MSIVILRVPLPVMRTFVLSLSSHVQNVTKMLHGSAFQMRPTYKIGRAFTAFTYRECPTGPIVISSYSSFCTELHLSCTLRLNVSMLLFGNDAIC